MQPAIKLLISIIVVTVFVLLNVWGVQFLRFVWSSQIDTKETFWRTLKRFVSLPKVSEVIVVRAPDRIYQDGKEVGTVIGEVKREDSVVTFEMLSETADLKENLPFEYQKDHFRIISVKTRAGVNMRGTVSKDGKLIRQEYRDVMQDVTCERLP